MFVRISLTTAMVLGWAFSCRAEGEPTLQPEELQVLKACLGVWDAEIEVWPQGPGSPSIKFKGVETNRAYGEYWIASDFDSEFGGQVTRVHSIVGYDLDKKRLVGNVIDHGPYAATMTGDYDPKRKSVRWTVHAKDANGKPMLQETTVTQENADERILVLKATGGKSDELIKCMQVRYTKRK